MRREGEAKRLLRDMGPVPEEGEEIRWRKLAVEFFTLEREEGMLKGKKNTQLRYKINYT